MGRKIDVPTVYSFMSEENRSGEHESIDANFVSCAADDNNKCIKDKMCVEHEGRRIYLKEDEGEILRDVVSTLSSYNAPSSDIGEIIKSLNISEDKDDDDEISLLRRGRVSFGILFVDDESIKRIPNHAASEIHLFLSTDRKLAESLNVPFPGIYGFNSLDFVEYKLGVSDGYARALAIITSPILKEVTVDILKTFEGTGLPIFYIFCPESDFGRIQKEMKSTCKAHRERAKVGMIPYKRERSNLSHFGIVEEDLPAAILIDGGRRKYRETKLTKDTLNKFINEFLAGIRPPYEMSGKEPEDNGTRNVKVVVRGNHEKYIYDKSRDTLVVFHSPHCRFCVELKPIVEKLGELVKKNTSDKVLVCTVDLTENDMPEFEVTGYPTLYLVKAGSNEAVKYDKGGRTLEELSAFIKERGTHKVDVNVPQERRIKADL
jgi:thiol-disulfide isomerase/thioredoxin